MNKQLFKAPQYCLITFATTSYALKAERILKEAEANFMMIPTLREISSSCGLSVKFLPEQLEEYASELEKGQVPIESVYRVKKNGQRNTVEELDLQ
jgi:hypothetical protein